MIYSITDRQEPEVPIKDGIHLSTAEHGPEAPRAVALACDLARPFAALYTAALSCHDWGANVTAIAPGQKRPLHPWKPWQQQRQTREDVHQLPWDRAAGVGIIGGVGGWRAFDLDHCPSFEPISRLLEVLGLPQDYAWVVRSGSGEGWQVWFRCDDPLPPNVLPSRNEDAGVFWAWPADKSFDHLELRWQNCQTLLPPSQHPTGPGYHWRGEPPEAPPAHVSIGQVLAALFAVAPITRRREEPTRPARPAASGEHTPQEADPDDIRVQIRQRLDLVDFARRHFGGELRHEGPQVRVLGHGGLLINPETGLWYCFQDQQGGDAIDLVGYAHYGAAWNRTDKEMFPAALAAAASAAGVELPARQPAIEASAGAAKGRPATTRAEPPAGHGGGAQPPPATPREEEPAHCHLSDLGNARRLLRRFGDQLHYVPAWDCWLIWDGTRWVKDETGGIDRLARKTVASMYEEAAHLSDGCRAGRCRRS